MKCATVTVNLLINVEYQRIIAQHYNNVFRESSIKNTTVLVSLLSYCCRVPDFVYGAGNLTVILQESFRMILQ